MVDPTLISGLCVAIEESINRGLRYDPATAARLGRLDGRSIALHVNELNSSLTLMMGDRVAVYSQFDTADLTLSGSLPSLIRLATSQRSSLSDSGVTAHGDIELLTQLRAIVSDLDLDWEAALNDIIGDLPGHPIAAMIRSQFQWLRQRQHSVERLASEFLTEEIRAIPAKAELDGFCNEVDDLRLRTDRLQQRMEWLQTVQQQQQHEAKD